jgi:hypothetical protein
MCGLSTNTILQNSPYNNTSKTFQIRPANSKLKLNLLASISDARHPPRRTTANKVGLSNDRDPAQLKDPQSSSSGGRHDLAHQIAIACDPALTAVTMNMINMLHVQRGCHGCDDCATGRSSTEATHEIYVPCARGSCNGHHDHM